METNRVTSYYVQASMQECDANVLSACQQSVAVAENQMYLIGLSLCACRSLRVAGLARAEGETLLAAAADASLS